jgi:phage tail sheath gpL-like
MATVEGKKTGGRKKGVPNKATREIKALAQKHGPEAIKTLINIMKTGKQEPARIAAAKELLDRAYGKSTQPISQDDENPLEVISRIRIEYVGADG